MIAIPFLALFFIALTFHILAVKRNSGRCTMLGFLSGVLCGLYVVFMIWLAAGWGDKVGASYIIIIDGTRLYGGAAALYPIVIGAVILTPLCAFGCKWVSVMLTKFVYEKRDGTDVTAQAQKDNGLSDFARGSLIFLGCFAYFAVGFLLVFLISDELQYCDSFFEYVAGELTHFTFCGLLLAIWLLFAVRFIVNRILALIWRKRKA